MAKVVSRQAIAFVAVGMAAAVVNVSARVILNNFIDFATSVAVAYFFGMTAAYLLYREFVFTGSRSASSTEFLRFAPLTSPHLHKSG